MDLSINRIVSHSLWVVGQFTVGHLEKLLVAYILVDWLV